MNYILDEFSRTWVSPSQYDYLLAKGWRHFGSNFFRYNISIHNEKVCNVLPLRLRVNDFQPSKSQRKILRKCGEFQLSIQKVVIDDLSEELFEIHKEKFVDNVPQNIFDFLSKEKTATTPTTILDLRVYDEDKLIAVSYFGVGENALSSIYGMFHPEYKSYSLGIFTMLVEIMYAKQLECDYYYHGYCYDVPSFYDYKKKFAAMETYLWDKDKWIDYSVFEKALSISAKS
ncbi:hypothetical protein [Flammeovirga sp. OC4]|uniref:hypothetical protein n=1 Tax=Flammeovirga sp. OC4 TaxID=1382345 RepID=UPI0005C69064|nr:hypothetical protein [Flammeovirga sp. OC4]